MTPEEMDSIGRAVYGDKRYLKAMHRDTNIPYMTLWRYRHGYTPIKPLAADRIRELAAKEEQLQ